MTVITITVRGRVTSIEVEDRPTVPPPAPRVVETTGETVAEVIELPVMRRAS